MADTLPDPATLLPWGHPGYRHPGPADVRAVVNLLGMTEHALANLVGAYDDSRVRCWMSEPGSKKADAIRYPAWRLMVLETGLVRFQPNAWLPVDPKRQARRARPKRTRINAAAGKKESDLAAPGHP